MQPTELTPHGVDKLLNGEIAIIQIIDSKRVIKQTKGQEITFMVASLSDGYCYLENVLINYDSVDEAKMENSVVKMSLYEASLKKYKKNPKEGATMIADPNTYLLILDNINRKIGCPMVYGEYLRNGKNNPKGSNMIYEKNEDQETNEEQDILEQVQKLQQKNKINQNLNQRPSDNSVSKISNSNQTSSISNRNQPQNKREKSSEFNPSKKVQQAKKKAPIQKPIVKVQQKKVTVKSEENSNSYANSIGDSDKIRDLFFSMDSFKLVARLLFIWPIKPYTNKKGIQSQLLNMEFGDDTGTIMCTVFGQNSNRYCNLIENSIYSIEGAMVSETNYKGVQQKKLTFGDGTKVNIIKGQIAGIPSFEKFCISLRELNECEKGRIVTVKCLLKQGDLTEFVSKAGNKIKKKTLKMFDIENTMECDLTLMNEKAEAEYIDGMYALKGVEVDDYNGKKQFKGSLSFLAKYLKNDPMNKRIKEIDEITFTCITPNPNQSNKQSINSFSALNQKSENLNLGQSLWSQVICYLKAVRIGGNSPNYYLGCPFCKKKITNESATDCPHCRKDFERPKYRYLLSLNLTDDHDNIWANAYDEGQKIMALPNEDVFTADSFVDCNEESLKQRVHSIRYKRMKLKIVSGKEEYNNDSRVKHKVVKVLPISYCEENKAMLENIKSVTSSL